MSSVLTSQVISAPGFNGLNSQDASADLPVGFALMARNCIIDKFGRVGSRKGTIAVGPQTIGKVSYLGEVKGVTVAATPSAFFVGGVTVPSLVPGANLQGAVITSQDNSDTLVLMSAGAVPLSFNGTMVTELSITKYPTGLSSDDFRPSIVTSGFGRLWAAGPNGGNILYFCDTLNPSNWATGTAGRLDLSSVAGEDKIMGVAVHNNSLVIFLRNNILIYGGAGNPNGLALTDTINGLGCIAKASIQNTGEDIIFLSRTGVRSLGRTILEKSAPLNDLSKNVRDELLLAVAASSEDTIKSVYSHENSFYLLSIPEAFTTYCFDTRIQGNWRVTTWTLTPAAMLSTQAGRLLFGVSTGVVEYTGNNDLGKPFRMTYASSWVTAGQPTVIKILKKLSTVIVGGGSAIAIKTAWDYKAHSGSNVVPIKVGVTSLFGQALFGQAIYTSGPLMTSPVASAGGAGCALQLIIETDVYNEAISIQTIAIYMKVGRSL